MQRLNYFNWLLRLGLLLVLGSGLPPLAAQTPLYVALDGSDQQGNGSLEKPFRTLAFAAQQAQPGSTIVVRGGVYHEQQLISARGTAVAPITIQPYPNETVVFDGQGLPIDSENHLILISHSQHLVFSGFEITNSSGRGLGVFESEHITLGQNRVHDIQGRGIGGGGSHILIAENEVWNASLENANEAFQATGGWKAGISIYKRADDSPSTQITIRNNHVHDVWGEGIIALFADGVLIEGNDVHDTYSVNIYVDNSRNVTVQRNHLYATTTHYNRLDRPYPAYGVLLGNEHYQDNPNTALENILIANNLIVGTGRGIGFWHDGRNRDPRNSYQSISIAYNVIMGTHDTAIWFEKVGNGFNAPGGGMLVNNIIYAGGNGEALALANREAWAIMHNNWPDGVPEMAQEPFSFAAPTQFIASRPDAAPEAFQLPAESANVGAGMPFPLVTTDYWGRPRSPEQPTIGLHEASLPPATPAVEGEEVVEEGQTAVGPTQRENKPPGDTPGGDTPGGDTPGGDTPLPTPTLTLTTLVQTSATATPLATLPSPTPAANDDTLLWTTSVIFAGVLLVLLIIFGFGRWQP